MLFSIVVPVYCVESNLKQCVDSILNQTAHQYELILVDDGSPDGSPAICDAYAKANARVRVIHQENKGVSAARNAGIHEAIGDYVLLLDGAHGNSSFAVEQPAEKDCPCAVSSQKKIRLIYKPHSVQRKFLESPV